jgi:hypothetical protein
MPLEQEIGNSHKPFLYFLCFAIIAKPPFVNGQTLSFVL